MSEQAIASVDVVVDRFPAAILRIKANPVREFAGESVTGAELRQRAGRRCRPCAGPRNWGQRPRRLPMPQRETGLEIPSFNIRLRKVLALSPRTSAAPPPPSINQFASVSTLTM